MKEEEQSRMSLERRNDYDGTVGYLGNKRVILTTIPESKKEIWVEDDNYEEVTTINGKGYRRAGEATPEDEEKCDFFKELVLNELCLQGEDHPTDPWLPNEGLTKEQCREMAKQGLREIPTKIEDTKQALNWAITYIRFLEETYQAQELQDQALQERLKVVRGWWAKS